MLKILWKDTSNNGVLMKLEGRICGPWVEEVRKCCDGWLDKNRSLALDMQDVTFLDREGATLLQELVRRNVRLASSNSFIDELLKALPET